MYGLRADQQEVIGHIQWQLKGRGQLAPDGVSQTLVSGNTRYTRHSRYHPTTPSLLPAFNKKLLATE